MLKGEKMEEMKLRDDVGLFDDLFGEFGEEIMSVIEELGNSDNLSRLKISKVIVKKLSSGTALTRLTKIISGKEAKDVRFTDFGKIISHFTEVINGFVGAVNIGVE